MNHLTEALENHTGTVSIGGRNITNLQRFADDIDGLAGEEHELVNLAERLNSTSKDFGMEISAEKTKLMTNNPNGINTTININGTNLETVENFKYLGAIISKEGSKPKEMARIAQTVTALAKLNIIWKDRNIEDQTSAITCTISIFICL